MKWGPDRMCLGVTAISWLCVFFFSFLSLSFPNWNLGMAPVPRLDCLWGQMLSCLLAVLSVWSSQATGLSLGPCRRLYKQGVLGQVGALAPPWVWVTCEGGVSRQRAAEGQGAGGPEWRVGPSHCPGLGVAPLTSRDCAGGKALVRRGWSA